MVKDYGQLELDAGSEPTKQRNNTDVWGTVADVRRNDRQASVQIEMWAVRPGTSAPTRFRVFRRIQDRRSRLIRRAGCGFRHLPATQLRQMPSQFGDRQKN